MPLDPDKARQREVNPYRKDSLDAQAALASTISKMETWQTRTKVLQALAIRAASDRSSILAEAKTLRGQIVEARTEIILILADAAAGVAGHSRVVDVEKALDTLDVALKRIERGAR